jgi:hypothetical protein
MFIQLVYHFKELKKEIIKEKIKSTTPKGHNIEIASLSLLPKGLSILKNLPNPSIKRVK